MKQRPLSCPKCNREFPGEEFCPDHGARLRPGPAAANVDQPPQVDDPGTSHPKTQPGTPAAGLAARLGQIGSKLFKSQGIRKDEETGSIPPELSDWRVEDSCSAERDAEATWSRVCDATERTALFKRYASAGLTGSPVYERLREVPTSHPIARLLAFGAYAGQTYELLEVGREATRFHRWIQQEVSETAALWFINQSADMLRLLDTWQVTPVWLEPSSFHLEPQGLKLSDFGKMVLTDHATSGFIPVLPPARTEYAAPEVLKSKVWHSNSVLYSLGSIAFQMTVGHAPTHAVTECGDLEFARVEDQRLQQALMGLLHPDPHQRWQMVQLDAWRQAAKVDVPDWSHLRPGAARTPFVMHGHNHFLPRDLASALLKDLDLSAERLEEALCWLQTVPTQVDVVNEIQRHRRAGRSSDWLLLRLAFLLAPDAPRIWRGISLEDQDVERNLIELARRAMEGDGVAQHLVDLLDASDLREVFKESQKGERA